MKNLQQIEKLEETPELEPKPDVVFDLKPIRHGLRAKARMRRGENLRYFNDLCDSLDETEWNHPHPHRAILRRANGGLAVEASTPADR